MMTFKTNVPFCTLLLGGFLELLNYYCDEYNPLLK